MENRSPLWRQAAIAYACSLGFWLAFSPLMAAESKIRLGQRGVHADFWTMVVVNSAWCVTFALLTPPIFFIVRKYPVTRQRFLARVGLYALGVAPFMLAFACVRWTILPAWDIARQQYLPRTFATFLSIWYVFADQIWTYMATVVAAHAWAYLERMVEQERERAELQQALAASELQALKRQLHPHFLFNTLHGISALIDTDRARAKGMVLKLSGLLRTALQYDNSDLVSFEEELRFVRAYLDIEKMRLGERLEVRWNIEPGTEQLLIPQLLLQPLVENAILHGIACCREGGWLEIGAERREERFVISLRNSVGGHGQPGLGLGLQNTQARLRHLFSDEASFSFAINEEHIGIARIKLPEFGTRVGRAGHQPVAKYVH
jgi:two-component system, LytTR family, sensor kinase